MKKLFSCCSLFLLLLIPGFTKAQTDQPYDTIMNRIRLDLVKPLRQLDGPATRNFKALQADGSWAAVNYKDTSITNWMPNDHLLKLQSLIQAYITKGSRYYGDEQVFKGISNAFSYWYGADPKSSNWWHNEIATPQALGELLIQMRFGKQQLAKALEAALMERMKRGDPEKKTGANKTDIALHYFYRALLTKDQSLMALSTRELFDPIRFVHYKEGLQYDYSYLQHGPQLQISSYGAVFITGVLKLAGYVRNTPYALNEDKLQLFSKYYRDSYLKTIRGSYIDFNVEGRGVSRPDILNKHGESSRLRVAKTIDPEHGEEWDQAIARTDSTVGPGVHIQPLHHQFWNGDYTLHLRPAYSFNVRMVSNRTKRSEAGNGENLLGRTLADGATNIQVRGPEYYNIMPVWEWDKIPGVTSRDYPADRLMTKFWGEEGSNAFAGGVSDKVYGASAYALDYDSLSAKKSWFFFDDEVVCLGAGINSLAAEPITTSLNQSWLNGSVQRSSDRNRITAGKSFNLKEKSQDWIWHDGIAYVFPEGGNLSLSTNLQQGNWFHINNSHPKKELFGNVFKLWINHGIKPRNDKYAYIVLPGIKAEDMEQYDVARVQVIANTETLQGVYHKQLGIAQAVFYQAGSFNFPGFSVKTDKACILMVRNVEGKQRVYVADPLQKEKTVVLTLTDLKTGRVSRIEVALPQQELAGSTVMAVFN
ncbi:chondroitinase-AC [Pedobacter caeni]|uniref:Chondroitin AC lyase n=1 Tax=Pedobacter caeni TaxID=288992 RepID=A0A1M5HDP9_9SPHI|nr:chondroitinase-AC [Pedobacter caeni]SHG14018.1 chondroitin AC lyase [Pedobacter caeni]